jgi:hypothetical protein
MIFYSWQADLPNATNRGLIQSALERAAKALADDVDVLVEPVIDRDTLGVSGSPDISSTILDKIARADAVISDVSIVTQLGAAGKASPNPNVLLEFGYALREHGWQRVVMVMNKHYGPPELLPFDLRGRRALTYPSAPTDASRSEARQSLQSQFEAALRAILANRESSVGEVVDAPAVQARTLPRLRLREPGAVHIVPDVSFFDATGAELFRVDSLRVRFVNDPVLPASTAVAHGVGARISVRDASGVVLREIDARWSDSPQPKPLESVVHLLRVDFRIQEEREIDVALKNRWSPLCYLFNNDSYPFIGQKPDFALDPGVYTVVVRLVGVEVDESFEFSFSNPGAGERIRLCD